MTKKEFRILFGRDPVQDDLARVNCRQAGILGHQHCGLCEKHKQPRFMCGCLAPLREQAATESMVSRFSGSRVASTTDNH